MQTTVSLGDDSLRPAEVADFALRPGGYRVAIAPDARVRMHASVDARDALIATRQPIYGVTTGFGDSHTSQIAPERAAALQRNLILYHLVGSGPIAPAEVARATMLVRANCLARGWSGLRVEVVALIVDCLAADILPVIPERGSVGASGDLVPLCYLAAMLTGQGEADQAGVRRPAAEALRAAGLVPAVLQPKEALALINGTSFMCGFAAVSAAAAGELALAAEVATALCSEVLRGNVGHFAPAVHAQKPHPGQIRSAARIRALLDGSALARTHAEVLADNGDLGDTAHRRLDHGVQDRYSVRCAPHVIGVLRDTLTFVDRWLEVEVNSTNDNPLFDPETGAVHNGGNFYGGHVGLAMDTLKTAVASVGDLLDRQLALIVDERYSNGLPSNLTARSRLGDPEAGLHHGFKGVQIAASSLVAEALKAGMPATAFSRSTEAHNQDKVSMGTVAARDARTVVGLTSEVTALHLAALVQAVDLRGGEHLLGTGTRAAYALVRKYVAPVERDRRLDTEVAALADAVRTGELRDAVSAAIDLG